MRLRAFAAFAIVVIGLACSDDGGLTVGPTPASITINGGNTQVGPAGVALGTQLSVIVRVASGNPLPNEPVNWIAATGGGSVSPLVSLTNAAGIASTTRTLGANAGVHTTAAAVLGLASVTFTAVAQIQGATQIALGTGNSQTDTVLATLSEPLTVVVRDQNNAPVAGVVVIWTATGGGSVSTATSTTSASGIASISRTFGATAGAQGAQATVTGLAGSPVTFTATATAGNAAVLVKTAGDNGVVAPSGQAVYTVITRDAHGNAKGGVTVDWAVASGGGSILPASNTTGAGGTASATHTLSATLGAQTATATAAGLGGSPATFTTTAANFTSVSVGGATNVFNPTSVTIPVNGIVNFNWAAGNALSHNVTFAVTAGAPGDVPDRTSGNVPVTFSNVGAFNYSCTNHPGMNGSVTVTP